MRIDVTAASIPENYPRAICGWGQDGWQPCVALFPTTSYLEIVSYPEWKNRFVIVDVKGETVVIEVAAPADKFEEFLPKAQKVLDTVEWVGAQAPSSGEDGENNSPS